MTQPSLFGLDKCHTDEPHWSLFILARRKRQFLNTGSYNTQLSRAFQALTPTTQGSDQLNVDLQIPKIAAVEFLNGRHASSPNGFELLKAATFNTFWQVVGNLSVNHLTDITMHITKPNLSYSQYCQICKNQNIFTSVCSSAYGPI